MFLKDYISNLNKQIRHLFVEISLITDIKICNIWMLTCHTTNFRHFNKLSRKFKTLHFLLCFGSMSLQIFFKILRNIHPWSAFLNTDSLFWYSSPLLSVMHLFLQLFTPRIWCDIYPSICINASRSVKLFQCFIVSSRIWLLFPCHLSNVSVVVFWTWK